MSQLTFTLLTACYNVLNDPALKPADGNTYCNVAVARIASSMGYHGFFDIVANDIVKKMETSSDFDLISIDLAQGFANSGDLVIAGQYSSPHGHVCVICPGETSWSGAWKKTVPVALNVGINVFMGKRISFSFKTEPKLWRWKGNGSLQTPRV